MTTTTTDRAPRRRHAAGASRILAGGLSVATTLGLAAHWGAAAERVELTAGEPAAQSAPAPTQRIVIVRRIIREVPADLSTAETSDGAPAVDVGAPAPRPAVSTAPATPVAPAVVPSLPSAALAPPPVITAPAPTSSSQGS